jgi:hypothetical protein
VAIAASVSFAGREKFMKQKIGSLRYFILPLLFATAAKAQVGVAVGDIGIGAFHATEAISKGIIKTSAGTVITVSRILGSSVVTGVVGGTAIAVSSLVIGTTEIGVKAGVVMLPPVAAGAKDLSLGVLKAGWHIVGWGVHGHRD